MLLDLGRAGLTDPVVSVILTAYNRHEYLRTALESVIAQNLDRSDFEVIISKNFDDPELEGRASAAGCRIVRIDCGSAGTQVAEAVEVSRGQIIALLDDDDAWLPHRLAHVVRRFHELPPMQYYANTYLPIDSRGNPEYGRTRRRRAHVSRLADGTLWHFTALDGDKTDYEAVFHNYPGNNSSIALSRELIARFESDLRKISISIDHFLLVAGLLGGGDLVIERVPLTLWRVHQANTSGAQLANFSVFCSDLASRTERLRNDNYVLLDMAVRRGENRLANYLSSKVELLEELLRILKHDRSTLERRVQARKIFGSLLVGSSTNYWTSALLKARLGSILSTKGVEVALYLYFQRHIRESYGSD